MEIWLKDCLLPKLNRGDVIVIALRVTRDADNASFYRSQAIDEIVGVAGHPRRAEAECKIWYLPPYSPDLNKIERWRSTLKNWA